MNAFRRALKALGGGIVVTLVTGLFNITPGGMVGAVWYGFPVKWLTRLVIAPQYNPWRVAPLGFAADVIIWFIVVWILVWIYCLATGSHKKQAKKAATKRKR